MPPGSTFKPITAMAALESGKMRASDPPIYDSGAYWKAPYIKCWQAHGWVNFYQAIARSCNTFFQYAGEKAGIEHTFPGWPGSLAWEKLTGLKDLGGEAKGVLPTPEWKKELNSILS
ncbi:MAG: penicillin-binding transpeptidase domain-containing protein [Bacillota bacterium]